VWQWAGWLVALALTFYIIYSHHHHSPAAHPATVHNDAQARFLAWMASHAHAVPAWPAEWAKLNALVGGVGEGHMFTEQAHYYTAVGRLPFVRTVCEIGFNAGHSAAVWLTSQPDLRLQSFDIGMHGYVRTAANHIKAQFPGRFDIELGDSVQAVPGFVQRHPGFVCDVLHVDGAHEGDIPRLDLANMRALARPHSILLMDDLQCPFPHCRAPRTAWDGLKAAGEIEEWDCQSYENGERGWCVGRYVF
jgi:hypothetical protein